MQSFLTDLRHVSDELIVFSRSTVQCTLVHLKSRAFLDKLIVLYLTKIHPAFYGNLRFMTVFTTAHQLFIFWFIYKHPTPYSSTSLRFIFTLSQRLRLVLPSFLFPSLILRASLHPLRPTGFVRLILCYLITQEIHAFFVEQKTQNFH